MNKTINFKLINISLIAIICYFGYQARDLWFLILNKFIEIISPILFGFIIAYLLYPFLIKLKKYKINKYLATFIIVCLIIISLFILLINLIPLLKEQIINIVGSLIYFTKEVSLKININVLDKIMNFFNSIIFDVGYLSIEIYKKSINLLTNIIIIFSSSIYFLLDMDKIRIKLKQFLIKKNIKIYNYLLVLDKELQNYTRGMITIIIISFFEYTILYSILGHKDALLLGVLSGLSNLIPSFGGIIVIIIAFITSYITNHKLGLMILFITFIFSMIDSYIINPFVYKKSNKLHPLIMILSVFIGSILFGPIGFLISLPITIIIITTYKYYKK